MWEVLQQNIDKIENSNILVELSKQIQENLRKSAPSVYDLSEGEGSSAFHLSPKGYFMVSVHREENVDNPENLKKILTILNTLAEQYKLPVIVSTHPRTRKRIENLRESVESVYDLSEVDGSSAFHLNPLIHFMKPFGFTDYVSLQMNAKCTISDSGTISEESSMLQFPAISLRQSMERPEAQDTGSIILTGFEPDIVLNAIATVIDEDKINQPTNLPTYQPTILKPYQSTNIPNEYMIDNTSWRVLKLILGNTKLSNKWWGVK
jgi:UDP-N-acetylglucosamine 2-epimerase (non-hydrolysing)